MNRAHLFDLFKRYNPPDVVKSLFAFATWNPNRSAEIRILYAFLVFCSFKASDFQADSINNYATYRAFCEQLTKALGPSISLEDYIPEGDWGKIEYFFETDRWKFLYGSGVTTEYDFIKAFELIYSNYAGQFEHITGHNPISHLRESLKYTNSIIMNIPQPDGSSDIKPGHLETPPEVFWNHCRAFCESFEPHVSATFLISFALELGAVEENDLLSRNFFDRYLEGKYQYIFVKIGDRYFPMIPRRTGSALIDHWHTRARSLIGAITTQWPSIELEIGLEIGRYVSRRIPDKKYIQFFSLAKPPLPVDDFIFSFAILSRQTMFLFAFISPFSSVPLKDQIKQLSDDFLRLRSNLNHNWEFLLHSENKRLQIRDKNGNAPSLQFIVIVPNLSPSFSTIELPSELDAEVWFLEQFLGVIDEFDSSDDLSDFFEFKTEFDKKSSFTFSITDTFCAYKDSDGILVEGAIDFSKIIIDPHWGSAKRYKTLAEFWETFPRSSFFSEPRSWKTKKDVLNRLCLSSKTSRTFAYSIEIGCVTIIFVAPFEYFEILDCQITDSVMQILADVFLDYKNVLSEHLFFRNNKTLRISLFSKNALGHPNLPSLEHILLLNKMWGMDAGHYSNDEFGIKIVIDTSEVKIKQTSALNRSFDVMLFHDVIGTLNKYYPDAKTLKKIYKTSEKSKEKAARYPILEFDKVAAFPIYVPTFEPEIRHFKAARNHIAEVAKMLSIVPAEYSLTEAKERLNKLTQGIYERILREIERYDFVKSINFLITCADALTARYAMRFLNLTEVDRRDVAFDASVEMSKDKDDFQSMHRNYRFIIEAFVLIQPQSPQAISPQAFSFLVALVDWFFVFSGASDQLHFDIQPVSLQITREFLVNVDYENEAKEKMSLYGKEIAQKHLGRSGSEINAVESPRPIEEYLKKLDEGFFQEFGFEHRHMIAFLHLMSLWPGYFPIEEKETYEATHAQILEVATATILGSSRESISKILEFLTLRPENLLKIIDYDVTAKRLPVWEHYKRHSRYTIRPLIQTKTGFLWGPYSTERARRVWLSSPLTSKMPVNLKSNVIDCILAEEKKLKEDQLVVKAADIARRVTPLVESNVQLHKRDKKFGHPHNLGDYDLICYFETSNTLLLAECKHLLPVYCMKDARDLREDIFGKDNKKGYLEKIENRDDYAKSNCEPIFRALQWDFPAQPPKITSAYLSIHSYWWTRFPPYKTCVEFLQVDMFDAYLKRL